VDRLAARAVRGSSATADGALVCPLFATPS
jgi:hypothetical protein